MRYRYIIAVLIALFILGSVSGCELGSNTEPGTSLIEWENHDMRAEQFMTAVANGDFSIAAEGFNAEVYQGLRGAQGLRVAWRDVCGVVGSFISIEGVHYAPDDEYDVYEVITRHRSGGINTRLVFTDDGLITGIFFRTFGLPKADSPSPAENENRNTRDLFIILYYLLVMLATERLIGVFFQKRRTPLPLMVGSYLLYFVLAIINFTFFPGKILLALLYKYNLTSD